MKDNFNTLETYLNERYDSNTLRLEIEQNYNHIIYLIIDFSNGLMSQSELEKLIVDELLEIWETGYNYGYHDANADNGLTLQEQE